MASLGAVALACAGMLGCIAARAQGVVPIVLHAQERPPYSTLAADAQVHGLVADPSARAFRRAGIAFVWAVTPSQRQLALIQAGQGQDCGVGWFRNAEREAYGKFTRAIYQDQALAALSRIDGIKPGRSLAEQLADADAPLLVKDGYSYGPEVDQQIARFPANVRRTTAESLQMARMVGAGRAGWMIVAPEEAGVLLADPALDKSQLRLVQLRQMPAGQSRHILCSRAVPDAVIERLNQALLER